MRYLTVDEIILIHERILDAFAGREGVRDLHLLDSAAQRPKTSFSGAEAYPTLFHKAASLGHSLVQNHPFVDGNKRTAWEAMKRFIGENGWVLRADSDDIVEFMLAIASNDLDIEAMAAWLERRSEPAGS